MPNTCPECIRQHGPHYRGECEHGTRTGEFASEAEIFWLALGFEREGTGGNCDAYRLNLPSGRYILVTLAKDEKRRPEVQEAFTL